MLPVTVIGGYLGAGKTTLVNHLLRNADGLKLAVLVNEFGALPIDEDLIEAQDDTMISIAGGCICCSYGNDLIQAMMDLSKLDQKPDHILIESSGVAMPGAIASSVSIMDGLHIDGVIVLADAETIKSQAGNAYIGDTIDRQLSDADLVMLNKCDLIAEGQLNDLHSWVGGKAPNAAIVRASDVAQSQDIHPHADAFETKVITFDHPCDAQAVAERLAGADLNLIRAKGFVPTADGLRAIHVVGRRWAVSDAPTGVKSGVVVIAEKQGANLSALPDCLGLSAGS